VLGLVLLFLFLLIVVLVVVSVILWLGVDGVDGRGLGTAAV
jgi:hypothetical protein